MDKNKFKNKSVFTVSYDMEETKEHLIDAASLGHSLINMSELIHKSNTMLNGDDSNIDLQVQANKEGSFSIELVAWYNDGGKELLTALGLIGVTSTVVGSSLLATLKHLKDRKIKLTENVAGSNQSIIEIADGEKITVETPIAKLITEPSIRKNLSEVINKPIAGTNNASFKIKDENETVITTITSEEAIAFTPISSKSVITITETEKLQKQVTFATVNFGSISSGWKVFLPNQDNPQTIKMKDQAFINKVNSGYEEFAKDKKYLVNIDKEVTTQDGKITKTVYSLKEVIRVIGGK